MTSFENQVHTLASARLPPSQQRSELQGSSAGTRRSSSGARPLITWLEIEMSSSDMDGDESAAVISSPAPPALAEESPG